MRLIIATGLYAPEVGGPATYTTFLETYLPKYGIEFVVLPFNTVRKIPRILKHIWYTILLVRIIRHGDIPIALDTVSVGLPVMLASFLRNVSYIVRVPGDYAWEQGTIRYRIQCQLDAFQNQTHLPLQVRFLKYIQKLVTQRASWVIVPSEYMRRIVKTWGINEAKITRIYSALRLETVEEDREILRLRYGYGNDFTIVSSGRLVPWKGMSGLIQTLHTLTKQGKKITLRIIGDGVSRDELQNEIKKLNLEAQVFLEGKQTHAETVRRIKAADLFVLNTGYEGLSHQLIETMFVGTPIITTAVGGNGELITSGESGILIAYNDSDALAHAIVRMEEHPQIRNTYAENARKEVERFSEEHIAKEFIQFIHEKVCG